MDMATLNTRVGWGATTNSSLGWFRDNSKADYRTYGLENMSGYHYYNNNINGTGWYSYNCTDVHVGTWTPTQKNYMRVTHYNPNGSDSTHTTNCITNCTSNCWNCLMASGVYYSANGYYGIGTTGQCNIGGQCDSRSWLQPNCNCAQCNCACNCYAYGQCTEINCACDCECANCTCACAACVMPETLVTTTKGEKPIVEVVPGDFILDSNGDEICVSGIHIVPLGKRALWILNNTLSITGDHIIKYTDGTNLVIEPILKRLTNIILEDKYLTHQEFERLEPGIHVNTVEMGIRIPGTTQVYSLICAGGSGFITLPESGLTVEYLIPK